MLKLLIADDEKMICSLIAGLLDWNALGYEIIGMAYTGIDAYEMIIRNHPDVIISDIRMPGYDGLELIKKTREAKVEAEFVMISGFKQFEYAQNAMKYGVKYYLLKPIEEEKLLEIGMEIQKNIQQKKEHQLYEQNLELEIKETKDKMKKRFLTSMFFGVDREKEEEVSDRNEINAEYSTCFREGIFQAIFMKVDTMENEEENTQGILIGIRKRVERLSEVCEECITVDTHSGTITLVNYRSDRQELVQKEIEELYEKVSRYVSQFEGFSVVAGIGKRMYSFLESRKCLETAADAIKYRIRIPNTSIIYYEAYPFVSYEMEQIMTAARKQDYVAKVAAGDAEGAADCLTDIIRKIRFQSEQYSPVLFFDILILHIDLLTEYCRKNQFYSEEYAIRLKKWNMQVDNLCTEKQLLDVTKEFIKETLEGIEIKKREKDIRPIRLIKKYIEEHYMEEINLNQLAELVDMNASYLSSIFKKETGMTYSEYLIHCRTEQASRLLVETNMSVHEIAHSCGYSDARYFSKQYMKQIGLKPSEYRKLYS